LEVFNDEDHAVFRIIDLRSLNNSETR